MSEAVYAVKSCCNPFSPPTYRKRLTVSHIRTLKMSEDVLGVRYSPDQRLLAVALLDCTVKIFFADTLKVRKKGGGEDVIFPPVDSSNWVGT